ncbi:DsrE family protein [Lactobacillus sp. CC-MHH1034]|uniref:DsrE family protein n=1 Tax=Agrilactobacillus fermenti TaxID=2586909 RepID=UPI001E558C4F|nr:DsrE family protein [Agrilactobacillus fermenti]MCD2255486.1 DsrE family protein [Agrilactobacillus fermenti]
MTVAQYQVVFHVSEPGQFQHAIANIKNLYAYQQAHSEMAFTVVLLVNGAAITVMTQPETATTIATLPQVQFHACHNSMRAHQITAAQLPAGVTVVPVGVLDLIELESKGYAYIKP